MNIKHLLTCFFLLTILVSCEEIGKLMKSDDIDDGTTSMIEMEEGDTLIEEDNSSKSVMPMTKSFYTNLLDCFCQKYFDEKFTGEHYHKGSIVIVKMNHKSDSTVEISGTHSYKVNQGSEVKGQMYKASIKAKGDNLYRIKFEKGSSKILSDNSYWDNIEEDFFIDQ